LEKTDIKYSFSTYDNSTFLDVKELSEDEYNKYSSIIINLMKLENEQGLYKIIVLNYNDFIAKTNLSIKNINLSDMESFSIFYLDINRHILNVLSSIRTYLDHTETRLKKEFGKNHTITNKFKELVKKAYDENFSYRFLYKLRNYSQHCGLPAGSLKTTASNNGGFKEVLTLALVRDDLLNNYDSWSIVKEEIKNKDEEFDIINLLKDKVEILKNINEEISKLVYNEYFDEANSLMELLWLAKNKTGTPCLLKQNGLSQNVKLSVKWFPYNSLSKITGVVFDLE